MSAEFGGARLLSGWIGLNGDKLRFRLGQGRKMFCKLRPVLCCPRIPEEERIKTFHTTVASSVLWGAVCWIPSTKTQQFVSIQETRWLRCMLGGRKAQDVPWVNWFRATKRSAQALRCKLNCPSLWHRALAAVYGWAGHVARKDSSHPGHAAIRWRNAEWWEIMKSAELVLVTDLEASQEKLGAQF